MPSADTTIPGLPTVNPVPKVKSLPWRTVPPPLEVSSTSANELLAAAETITNKHTRLNQQAACLRSIFGPPSAPDNSISQVRCSLRQVLGRLSLILNKTLYLH